MDTRTQLLTILMTNLLSAALVVLGTMESNNNDLAIGAKGEVSRYQIMPMTWKVHALPFRFTLADARDEKKARLVALSILSSLKQRIETDDHFARPLNLYVAWNWGITNWRMSHGIIPPIHGKRPHVPSSVLHRAVKFEDAVNALLTQKHVPTI